MIGGSITDVPGIRVGHHHRLSASWRTGTTVVLADDGAVGGVDVRGGGPGTRETDLLRPENLVQQVHAVVLSGGSAFGLAAADGVMDWLAERGVGYRVGPAPDAVVPIVPGAVIFDLGRAGDYTHRPDASFGRRAARAARRSAPRVGTVGAGTGAVAGGLQGGVGTASTVLADGTVVAALMVVNAAGSVIDPTTARPWEAFGLGRPSARDRAAFRDHLAVRARMIASLNSTLNTTIGVVATSARLTKAECTKVSSTAHDGLARAVRPAHSMNDGDTIFTLATGRDDLVVGASDPSFRSTNSRPAALNAILDAAATVTAAACVDAVLRATSVPGGPPAYGDLCPTVVSSAFPTTT